MPKEEFLEFDGQVTDSLPSTTFKVKPEEMGQTITCQLAGRLRMNNIRVLVGDKVRVQVSPYDLSKGRITYRY